MTDEEQNLISLALRLHDGLREMLARGCISESDIPDDWEWLNNTLNDISTSGRQSFE